MINIISIIFTALIIVIGIYIKVKDLKPSENYKGEESGFEDRANEVIYYRALKKFSGLFFPVIVLLNLIDKYFKLNIMYNFFNKYAIFTKNIARNSFAVFFLILTITLLISKIYTRYKVQKVIREGELHKYIGEYWIDTSS